MFSQLSKKSDAESVLKSLDRSQAVIEFDMDGTILAANGNFLATVGYTFEEIKGKHHSIFVEKAFRDSPQYQDFWTTLKNGQFIRTQFKRIGKDGREVWLEASYNPVLRKDGTPRKVIKYATDITAQKREYADLLGQINAIKKSQAVIEFNLDGTIITANENFLSTVGYSLQEIEGKHHSIFVESELRGNSEYNFFWKKLRNGEFQRKQWKRVGKENRIIWLEASYNPIFDLNGVPFKVVKFATDITDQVKILTDLNKMIDVNFTEIETAISQSDSLALSVGSAAGQTFGNVQTIAASAEELSASIGEISNSMVKSQSATDRAVEQTLSADMSAQRLAQTADDMGNILGLIQSIAAQINLLALNATIEAARAGEAGKGFAVVANEVKNLAGQAAKATEQIGHEIERVRSTSHDVVCALDGVTSAIEAVRQNVSITASAVEEQTAVTRDMSHTMQNAAIAVETITGNIAQISAAIGQSANALLKTREAAQILAR